MKNRENIVKETTFYIVNRFLRSDYKFTKSQDYIGKKFPADSPYYIADEAWYFNMAINDLLVIYAKHFLDKETSMFPMFPFSYVFPLDPLWLSVRKNIDPHVCLFMGENFFLCTPRLSKKQETAPIYCFVKDIHDLDEDEGILCYSSLTNLLLMVAECYTTGAYYYGEIGMYDATWREDFSKSEPIFHKYHPGLPFRSPRELEHFNE
jgi:hypothetical protein